jgi:hypothetical protein
MVLTKVLQKNFEKKRSIERDIRKHIDELKRLEISLEKQESCRS